MTGIWLGDLTSADVGELLAGERIPVLLWPLGAVEPHGPHAPLRTDEIISEGMCERAARALAGDPDVRALVLPSLPYGVTRFGASFPGAVGIAEATLAAVVADVCAALAEQGFARVVLVNNHFEPAQVATLRDAVARIGGLRVALLDLTRRRNAERLTDEFRRGSCHAGRYETSLVLADHPALVDRDRLQGLPALEVDMPGAMAAGAADFVAMGMEQAYCGAPTEADAREGEKTFATLTDMLVTTIRELAAAGDTGP